MKGLCVCVYYIYTYIYIYIYIYIWESFYYKELVHTIMEAEKSEIYSQKAGDTRRAEVEFQSESKGLRIRRAPGINSSSSRSPKAAKDKCPRKLSHSERKNSQSALLSLLIQMLISCREWTPSETLLELSSTKYLSTPSMAQSNWNIKSTFAFVHTNILLYLTMHFSTSFSY